MPPKEYDPLAPSKPGSFPTEIPDDPQALQNVNLWEVEAKIRNLIAELQASILTTFEPHGG